MNKHKFPAFGLFKRIIAAVSASVAAALLLVVPAAGQTVTQGYFSDSALQRGMLVAIKQDDTTKVEPVNAPNADRVHGVVVGGSDAVVSFSEPDQKVLVATSGKFEVLVSDQNGPIKGGDYIAVSSLSGIGMLSDENQAIVIGRSLDDFKGEGDAHFLSKTKLKDSAGGERDVNLGRVTLDIIIGKNPLAKNQTNVPEALRRAGEVIAGKPVATSRIYVGLVLLIVSAAIAASVIYNAVRSGIISIGRNPLSKKSIIRGIFQMVIVSFIIFFSGIFGVYLILKL